jgi:hypothetical protein
MDEKMDVFACASTNLMPLPLSAKSQRGVTWAATVEQTGAWLKRALIEAVCGKLHGHHALSTIRFNLLTILFCKE